jgi:hypothetical protein
MVVVPILGIGRLVTWEFRKKYHLGVVPAASHIEYYKGEGGGFPHFRAMVSLCML